MADLPRGAPRGSQRFGDANVSDGSQSFQGIVHGDVHLHHRPETPPTPTANIPFSRDQDFVRRGAILDQVHQLCAEAASRVALVGLGGVGKSQIAIEYAYQVRDQSPETWVFWVYASNAARYEQSFRAIADLVKIPGRQDPQNNILQLVGNWLQRGKSGRWVVILDNVDNAGFLLDTPSRQPSGSSGSNDLVGVNSSPTSQTPISYLPYCPHGSILITSRRRDVALRLVEARDIVTVESMSQVDAVALIEKKLGTLGILADASDTKALAASLECMPLAIVQATSYISQMAPRCSVRQYLETFERSDRKRASLLDFEQGQLRRDREAKNSIILTWQISFDHIQEIRSSAADLLSMMCFCDRQGIPESLLRRFGDQQRQGNGKKDEEGSGGKKKDKEDKEQESDDTDLSAEDSTSGSDSDSSSSIDEEFERDVSTLRNFAFVSVNEDGTAFEMHRLVQLATRTWLQGQNQEGRRQEEFLRGVCAELPTGEYENWARWQVLLPQARSAAAQRPKNNETVLRDWATILYKTAWYLEQMGQGDKGQKLAEDAMKVRVKLFGRDNEESLWAISMVGDIYSLQGRWKDAEKLRVEVMESRKKLLGDDHPSTLTSISNLALTYGNQGRWSAAEELEVEVMESRKRLLGDNHPDTLTSMANLASTLWNQGRWKDAEELFLEVMESRKKLLGADHPSTLTSMANLAATYRNQGRWSAAEELEVEVMESHKKLLGADHPSMLTSISNLALTYGNQGRWSAAEELQVEVMESRKKLLGDDHPSTLTSMANLAATYRNQGRWSAAEELEVEVMESRKKLLGDDHPFTLISMDNLTSTYRNQGRWLAAEELGLKSLDGFRKTLGPDHPDTLISMAYLASTYRHQGRWSAAEELEVEVMESRKKLLGADHPSTLTSMNDLAYTKYNLGQHSAAIYLMDSCLQSRVRILGSQHPHTSSSAATLAQWRADVGEMSTAMAQLNLNSVSE